MAEYKNPGVLVSTEWASQHLNDPNTRFVEVDVDTSSYEQGHIAGAVGWNWQTQLQDNVRRDLISKAALEELLGKSGITNDTTILLYGDNNNWFAAYAFWQLKYYGHKDVRLINGGRKKWLEEKRPISTEATKVTPTIYRATGAKTNPSVRAKKRFLPLWRSASRAIWWMCGRWTNLPARLWRRQACPKPPSAQDIFPVPRIFPGRRPRMKTAHSRARMRWRSFMDRRA